MRKVIADCILSCFVFAFLITACTTAEVKQGREKEETAEPVAPQVYTEEQKETLDIFTRILEIYENAGSRKSAAQEAEVLYARIINEYPDTPLAQESYWKLISMFVRDYAPPDFKKADSYYYEFVAKYPGSVLRNAVQQTLINSYVRHAEWERLLKLCVPAIDEYKQKAKEPTPLVAFMYAEAHYRLGNLAEAVEGYEITLELYPSISFGKRAKKRLAEIRETPD